MLTVLMSPMLNARAWHLFSFFMLVGLVFAVMATAAGAEELVPSPTIIDVPVGARVSVAPVILTILGGTILPILNGIVLKTTASSGLSAVVNLVTSAVVVVVTYVLASPVFDVSTVLILFATTFVASTASYRGLWKPLSANPSPAGNSIANLGPGFVGPS